jgi:lantibiotic modifying enzyme
MQLQTPYGQKSGGQSLQPLINSLLLNASFIDNIGLMHGKMGISVYFFHLARSTRNKIYEEYADELIDEIYEDITVNTPVNFENGLAAFLWIYSQLHHLRGGIYFKQEMEYWRKKAPFVKSVPTVQNVGNRLIN